MTGRAWAIALFMTTTLLYVAAIALHFIAGLPPNLNVLPYPALYALAVVGIMIAVRQPGNRIAWLCMAIGLAFGIEGAGWGIALYGLANPGSVPNPEIFAVIGDAMVLPGVYTVLTLLLLLFPDGRLPSPRWKWVARAAGGVIFIGFIGPLVSTERTGWGRPHVDNPLAPPPGSFFDSQVVLGFLDLGLLLPLLLVSVAGSVAGLVFRYRRSIGVQRQQLKWFTFGSTVMAVLLVVAILLADRLGDDFGLAATLMFIVIPVSIGVAILRYRLYDIDRLVSRTASYALVVGVLAAVFVSVTIGLPQLLGLADDEPLLVAGATLATAGLFNPLRRRIQNLVDRRFNRAHYNAQREVDGFAARLRTGLEPDDIAREMIGVVAKTMEPTSATVWIQEKSG